MSAAQNQFIDSVQQFFNEKVSKKGNANLDIYPKKNWPVDIECVWNYNEISLKRVSKRWEGDEMISIRDVAKMAGVSPATVSRVMNGTAKVDEAKRQRVLQVIEETGFKPNEAARTLYKKSANTIGVILPNIQNPFFSEMAKAIEQETYKRGYRLMLCSSDNDPEKEKNSIDLLNRMNADGIILLTNRSGLKEYVEHCTIPVVILDREVQAKNQIACIKSNHYKGGRLAMEHLLECGCKNIVNLRGLQTLSSAQERFEGYLDVCMEQKIVPQYIECRYGFQAGLEKTEELLKLYPDVDGIIAGNDMVAISAYKVLTKNGYRVPEDVQIVGYDDVTLASLVTPELTTIAQPIFEMGTVTANVLIDYIEKKPIKDNYHFDVELIKRETTK